jgi:tetratricopeptide (TPR) repeat protein
MRMRRFSVALQLARRLESTFPNLKRTYWSEGLKGIETASDVASLREQLRLDQSEPTSAFSLAVLDGNPAAASRIVQQEPAVGYGIFYGPVSFPGELRLATLAFFRGDQAATRSLGDQALAKIETMKLSPRLEPATLMGKAAALALAGRTDEALRDARAAMARGDASDKFDALNLRDQLGQIYVILGRTEDALATLRDIFSGASLRGPMGIRTHPIWSRLKDDPRFEEILRSAKPL